MTTISSISRRDFLERAGAVTAGLVIAIHLPGADKWSALAESSAEPFAPNAWLRINSDDSILVMVDRSEMGQGVATSLPMLIAEELEADWSKIRIEFAPAAKEYANRIFGTQGTGGSTSIRAAFTPMRQAGAAAREMLVAAAAATWGVDRSSCRAEKGVVINAASGKRLTYGALVEKASTLPVPADVPLKDPKDWKIIGTRVLRLDTLPKVTGRAGFGIDVKVPGALTAVVARCPVFGGKVQTFDGAKALAMPGVKSVVQISSGIAVVADTFWHAKTARDAVAITWDEGPNSDNSSAKIASAIAARASEPGASARHDGDSDAVLAAAPVTRRIEATYDLPFLSHAPMEPMNATAHVRADSVEIWVPTQFQSTTQSTGARIGGVPPEKVQVHTTYLGGGFGRRAGQDFVAEALETSKAVGAPVKVIWTREDDMQHGFYRPISRHVMRGALDASGRPIAWNHRSVAQSLRASRGAPLPNGIDSEAVEGAVGMPYDIAAVSVNYSTVDTGVPVTFWRSVNNSFNAFVVETFIDELAHAAKQDPFEFRRALLDKSPRHKRVLELAAEKAEWGKPLPAGRARGIAVAKAFDSYVAQVAEVSVGSGGEIRVHRVVCAFDCGPVVNPLTVEAQAQSGIVYGLTAALYDEITIDRGRVVQNNFNDYRMLRMREMPVIEVHIVATNDPQGGVGEPGTPPIAPAVGNAVFALTGKRLRSLPFKV